MELGGVGEDAVEVEHDGLEVGQHRDDRGLAVGDLQQGGPVPHLDGLARDQPVRWRLTWLLLACLPALAIALSRVYLGVHYPSDIMAGWAAACAWTAAVYLLVFPHGQRPWQA